MTAQLDDLLAGSEEKLNAYKKDFEKYSYLFELDIETSFVDFLATATIDDGSESGNAVYDLQKFDEKISHYGAVRDTISKIKSYRDIGWLRVNVQPIKQALGVWVTQWEHRYTSFLLDSVRASLQTLHNFIADVTIGLSTTVEKADKNSLMSVMGHIRDVRKRMDANKEMMGPLRQMTGLLKKHGIDLEGTNLNSWSPEEERRKKCWRWS